MQRQRVRPAIGEEEKREGVRGVDPSERKEEEVKGFKWNFYVMQCAGVYDAEGNQIREGYEDEDVCKMNGILQEMLEHPGCIVMGWCDG